MSRSSELLGRLLQNRGPVRPPIWLYRGARRYVVLEVVDHPGTDEYVIVSGFGEQS
jgi:hypothetical protein